MAIYTPRGLKIRLDVSTAFALMQRLFPTVGAFEVLKTTEGLESVPAALAFISGVACFSLKVDPYHICLWVLAASLLGNVITISGLFIVPGLPRIGTMYSYASGFGVLLVVLALYGFVTVGWRGVLAFFVARLTAGILGFAIESWNKSRIYRKIGIPLSLAEINFFSAYRLHASEIGKSTDITVGDEELTEENWKPCFEDLARKWPEVVRRFTIN